MADRLGTIFGTEQARAAAAAVAVVDDVAVDVNVAPRRNPPPTPHVALYRTV